MSQAKLAWVVVCEKVIIDQSTNNITIINVVEQLNVPPPPKMDGVATLPITLAIVSTWYRDGEDPAAKAVGRTRIVDPEGKGLEPMDYADFEIDLSAHNRVRNIHSVLGFPITKEGLYKIQTVMCAADAIDREQWEPVSELPIFVRFVPELAQG